MAEALLTFQVLLSDENPGGAILKDKALGLKYRILHDIEERVEECPDVRAEIAIQERY
jgi:hypothetical protein